MSAGSLSDSVSVSPTSTGTDRHREASTGIEKTPVTHQIQNPIRSSVFIEQPPPRHANSGLGETEMNRTEISALEELMSGGRGDTDPEQSRPMRGRERDGVTSTRSK